MQNEQYSISIIIPVYNAEKYLAECLRSIQAQDLEDYEVICVDDGSTDNSLEILKNFSLADVRFKFFSKKNEGVSVARNFAIPKVQGKYFTFVDADDILLPGALSYFKKMMEKTGTDIFIELYGATFESCSYPIPEEKECTEPLQPAEAVKYFFNSNMGGYACGKMYRSDKLKHFRFPAGIAMMEDLYAFIRLFEENFTFCFSTSLHYGYRQHHASAVKNSSDQKVVDILFVWGEVFRIMNKFHYSVQEIRNKYNGRRLDNYVDWSGYSRLSREDKKRYRDCVSVISKYLRRNPCSIFMKIRVYILNGRLERLVRFAEYFFYGIKKRIGRGF